MQVIVKQAPKRLHDEPGRNHDVQRLLLQPIAGLTPVFLVTLSGLGSLLLTRCYTVLWAFVLGITVTWNMPIFQTQGISTCSTGVGHGALDTERLQELGVCWKKQPMKARTERDLVNADVCTSPPVPGVRGEGAPEEAEVYTPDDVFQYAFLHRNIELADMLDPDLDRGMVLPIPIHDALE